MKIENELLKSYIEENNLTKFTLKEQDDIKVVLTDKKSEMVLLQLFNFVAITVNGEPLYAVEKRKGIDGGSHWFIVRETDSPLC